MYIAKAHESKKIAIKQMVDDFKASKCIVFTNYRGLNVEKITEIRSRLVQYDAKYRVIKNRFALRAFRQMEIDGLDSILTQPTALALVAKDSEAVIKAVVDIADEIKAETKNELLTIKGSLLDGVLFDRQKTLRIAQLPSLDVVRAQLMRALQAPTQKMAATLNESVARIARTLQAIADQKEKK